MRDERRLVAWAAGVAALFSIGVLSACGGSSDDAAPTEPAPVVAAPAEPAASQHLNAGDAVFATFTTAAGETVQLSGDRDAAGLPAVIRSKITTRTDGTTTSTRKVDYDEQGRPVRATTDEGSLTLEYFTTGVSRATFRPAGTDNLAFEIVVPDFGPAGAVVAGPSKTAAVSRAPAAPRGYGQIEVRCGRSGVSGPFDGAIPTLSRRDRENTGFPQDYELPTPKRIGPGLYQYPLETIGVDADAQRHRLALDEAWENNCKMANLYKNKESIFIEQAQGELVERMLKLPLRFSAPLFIKDVVGLLLDFCNTSITKLAGQAYFLAAGQSSLYLSARATIAAAPNALSSPIVRWSYANSDATVAKQVLEMPEAACPSRPLEGRWVGALLLPQDPRAVVSNYAVNLTQAGDRLSGTWRIDAAQTAFFGEGTLSGSVSNNAVTLMDTGVTASNLVPPQYWCTKTLDYTFSVINGVDTLDGVFSGGDCLPGTTRITRP